MATCKYCGDEIEWREKDGRKYPTNPSNGARHECPKSGAAMPKGDSTEKRQAAGFDNPPETNTTTPATNAGLKVVEGQIVFLDAGAHKVTVKDRQGISHTFIWPAPMNDQMAKLKQWFFIRATGEQEKDFPDLWRLTAQEYFKRPDDWPASNHGSGSSGGRPFQPRNEKPIIMQVIFKEACETARQQMKMSEKFDEAEADAAWEWAVAKTEATMERLCKVGGVA